MAGENVSQGKSMRRRQFAKGAENKRQRILLNHSRYAREASGSCDVSGWEGGGVEEEEEVPPT